MLSKARVINLKEQEYNNSNVNIKIGTAENRDSPETIYIQLYFWIKNKSEESNSEKLKNKLESQLNDFYENYLVDTFLKDNFYFPDFKNNIFICEIPDNVDLRGKKNYVSLELNLHTLNVNSKTPYALNRKKKSELYEQARKIAKAFSEANALKSNDFFDISKKK